MMFTPTPLLCLPPLPPPTLGDKESTRLIPAGSLLSVSLVGLLEKGTKGKWLASYLTHETAAL